ncbi:MAG: LptF/LptG family permease [Bacteroidetes bacterium]|nr:LptF/LptG family permease [Bacteroidota bacterium]
MTKKLDILILRSFIGPFIITFFVTLFVLVMQFFWLYMDELLGKGLGILMILQLLVYMSATLVPMALPLGILLASIMTFGNMGENFELVAIKASGISLLRFMRPLLIFIIGIGGLAFFFNNNIIPVANLKALSLLYDLRNSKPTFNIRAGQFNNDIKDYSIRVGSKDPNGKTIYDIIIYNQTSGRGNDNIVLAKKGEMKSTPDKQFLIFSLEDGWRYEEGDDAHNGGKPTNSLTRMHFKKWDKVFDLSAFRVMRTNEDLFKGAYQMMSLGQLGLAIDSIKRTQKKLPVSISNFIAPYVTYAGNERERGMLLKRMELTKTGVRKYKNSFFELMNDSLKKKAVELATTNVRNIKSQLDFPSFDNNIQLENYRKYQAEWHRKLTLSFACILLFLIGAPLGAIIRKGGLGMPLVIAVIFFVVFHITSVIGEKLAKGGSLPAWAGMWMSTGMLLPIAFLLIQQARNDSQIFSKEWYTRRWYGLLRLLSIKKQAG